MIGKLCIVVCLALGATANLSPEGTAIPSGLQTMLQKACQKQGITEQPQKAFEEIKTCMQALFDADTIRKDIEAAAPHGALDEVFKKYCAKSPEIKTCLTTFTRTLSSCMEKGERGDVDKVNEAIAGLLDFVCHKEGDRIALFIAEGGPQCFQQNVNNISRCMTNFQGSIQAWDDFQKLTLNEQCSRVDQLGSCVVQTLESCPNPTPGNMVESLFRFVRNKSQCKSIIKT